MPDDKGGLIRIRGRVQHCANSQSAVRDAGPLHRLLRKAQRRKALDGLLEAYGSLDLFRLVTYDAGACSLDNATYAHRRGVHYLFGLKGSQPSPLAEAVRCLGEFDAAHAAANERSSGQRTARRGECT